MSDFDSLFKPKPKLQERMQRLLQPRSASAVSNTATLSAGGAPIGTGAATASGALASAAASSVPRPAAAEGWTAKSRTAARAASGPASSAAMQDTVASSQTLDAYSSGFAWMRSLPTPVAAEAQPSATAAVAQPTAQDGSAQVAMVGHGDADELWDMEVKPAPRRSGKRQRGIAANSGSGGAQCEDGPHAAADVAAVPAAAVTSGSAGSSAWDGASNTDGNGSRGPRSRKRSTPEGQTPGDRLAQQLRGRGRPVARNGNGISNGPSPPAARTPAAAEEAQPNLANAPPAGPHEPLRLRGDSSGNLLQPEDEAATTDEEGDDGNDPPICGAVPASIAQYLRPYQREGVQFLWRQYCAGRGALLADDMGLGKTVQTIAFLSALLGKCGFGGGPHPEPGRDPTVKVTRPARDPRERQPILIVCPSSVMSNWQREFSTWGSFKVAKYHGASKDTVLCGVKRGEYEVMITTYGMLRNNIEMLLEVPWHLCVLDEVHLAKKEASLVTQAAMQLRTCFRVGLSGTVMSNNYNELWTVMNWASPNCMGDWNQFNKYYVKPMQIGQSADATPEEVLLKDDRLKELNAETRKWLVCRKKTLIADQLPKKIEQTIFCELSALQMRAYKRTITSPDYIYILSRQPCDCGSGARRSECCYADFPGNEEDREEVCTLWRHYHLCDCPDERTVTNPKGCKWHKPDGCPPDTFGCPSCLTTPALTVLINIANHLELIKADPSLERSDARKFQRKCELAQMVLGNDAAELGGLEADHRFLRNMSTANCGKLSALEQLLLLWNRKPDNKVLLFSRSVRMLSMVKALVTKHGWASEYLDGSIPETQRQKKVDDFNNTPSTFIFMISTRAGGLGLNLTSANKVVIVDPSWSPSDDAQAMDRAFRIGQRRNVHVYRLIATGTVEEAMYSRQVYKQQQTEMAMEGTHQKRYWQGVQDMQGRQGELWGIANLMSFTGDTIKTLDVLDAHKQREMHYEIQDYDPPERGELAEQPDLLHGRTARGRAAHAQGYDSTDEAADMSAIAPRLHAREGRATAAAPADDPIEDDAAEVADGADEDAAAELAALEVAGSVMGLRAHHNLLGPSAAEDAATMRARAAAAAEDRAMQQRLAAAEAAGFQGAGMGTVAAQDIATVSLAPPPAAPQASDRSAATTAATGSSVTHMGSGGGVASDLPDSAASGSQGPQQQQRPMKQSTLRGLVGNGKAAVRATSADAANPTAPSAGTTTASRAAGGDGSDGNRITAAAQLSSVPQSDMHQPTHPALDDERVLLTTNRSSSTDSPMTLTALESLASWQRMLVAEAARQVLALDEDARLQLQRDYALVHSA